jgi:hypothetical protein
MIYETQIFGKGSTLKWGFVFKRHEDDEDPIFVLSIGEDSNLCLKAIGESFAAHQWAAKAICDSYNAQERRSEPPVGIEEGIKRYAAHAEGAWPGPVATGNALEHEGRDVFVTLSYTRAKLASIESLDSLIGQLNMIRKSVYGSPLRLESHTSTAGGPEFSAIDTV